MSFNAPSSASEIDAAADIENVAGLGDLQGDRLDRLGRFQGFRDMARRFEQGAHEAFFLRIRQNAARAPGGDGDGGEGGELAGERLGRGDADLRAGSGEQGEPGGAHQELAATLQIARVSR